jgi:WS/DGAT/MGAT family acyltransferase|tara:strand:+ start:1264 stop:2856 length:1593 start_codon:yes stop_codon:yes gene_type:complete
MQQLTGLDASFLYLETPNVPMHISGLAIYDPSTAPGGKVGFKQIINNVMARSSRVPSMTNVLQEVPLSLDHPYWRADGNFDPEYHIRHMALPAPGDWRQLCILVSRLHARQLDRSRPLWEMNIIEGLDKIDGFPKGCFAVFTKVHHAAIDGASGVELSHALHDLSADAGVPTASNHIVVDAKPSKLNLVIQSQINSIKTPFRFISVARNTIPSFAKAFAGIRSGKLTRVGNLPRTRFNDTVSPHRVFDAAKFDFEDIRLIKNSVEGATVNDVALTIVGGALNKYLTAKGELPEDSMAAMAPINIRTKDKLGAGGNQVSQMTVKLCTEIDKPLERLKAVHEGTLDAKELTNAVGAKAMTDYTQFIPATLTASAARLSSSFGLMNQMAPAYNCVVTNVPGPQIPLYFTGAKMLTTLGSGPVIDGTGLFHVIGSYCGEFSITATCCRTMMPDPSFYVQCLHESLNDLKAAALALQAPTPATKAVTKKKVTAKPKSSVKAKSTAKPKTAVNAKAKSKAKPKTGVNAKPTAKGNR